MRCETQIPSTQHPQHESSVGCIKAQIHIYTASDHGRPRLRFTYPRESRAGLKNSLHAVFTRYLRGNHVRYIFGSILKYTANTGDSVFFLVVGGRRVFKFRVWCACLSHYSLFLSSRPFLPPCACAFSCSVHRHGPWLCAYRQVRNVTENFEESGEVKPPPRGVAAESQRG